MNDKDKSKVEPYYGEPLKAGPSVRQQQVKLYKMAKKPKQGKK